MPTKPTRTSAMKSAPKKSKGAGLIHEGQRLVFEMADFDVSDTYLFIVEKTEPALSMSFELRGGGEGKLRFADSALAGARSLLSISQGSATAKGEKTSAVMKKHLPPFLLSRETFAELESGEAEVIIDGRSETLRVSGEGTFEGLELLDIEGENLRLWVVRDAEWPLVVRRTADDENHWTLRAMGPSLKIDAKATFDLDEVAFTPRKSPKGKPKAEKLNSPEAKLRAIRKLADDESSEARRALFAFLGDAEVAVRQEAGNVLEGRHEKGIAEDACLVLTSEQKKIKPSDEQDAPSVQVVQDIVGLLSLNETLASHEPFVEAVRSVAGHAHWAVRAHARRTLVERKDEAIGTRLLALLDGKKAFDLQADDSSDLIEDLCAVIARLPPDAAKASYERLVEKTDPDTAWHRVIASVPQDDRGAWFVTFLDWWLMGDDDRRRVIERHVKKLAARGPVVKRPLGDDLPTLTKVLEELLKRTGARGEWREFARACRDALPKQASALRTRTEALLS